MHKGEQDRVADAVEIQDGTQAIEVVAMFEESVVELRHFSNAQAGVITPATKGLLGGAVASLLIALAIFVVSYAQVARLRAERQAWEQAGRPANEFIVPREGPLTDILATVFLVFGIGGMFVGLARLGDERQPRDFTIGPAPDALFNTPGELLPAESFPIVRSTGTDYELLFTANMQGDVTLTGGQPTPLAQLVQSGHARPTSTVGGAYTLPLPSGARAKIDLGHNTFLISSVPSPRHVPRTISVDWARQAYTGGVTLATVLFLLLIFSIPPDPKSLSLDAFMNDQRFVKFMNSPPDQKQQQIPDWLLKNNGADAGGSGQRHKGDEGQMGKVTSQAKAHRYAIKGPPDTKDPVLAKERAERAAENFGILGVLKVKEKAQIASIFGRDHAIGTEAENAMGGLVGTEIGEAHGLEGMGLVESGKLGGGTSEGTIGQGKLGRIGWGAGDKGRSYGRNVGEFGGHRASAPEIVQGIAQVRGSLDKEIIRRIIRHHLNEVKFCYENELMKKANLFGRVMVQFTISGAGAVIAAVTQQSTVNDAPVEQCIAQAVRRWEFPKPQGGGIVIVSYPFVLRSAGVN